MARFELHRVRTREEFGAVIDMSWEALQKPYRPEFQLLHPVYGHTEEDRQSSVKQDADRRWQWTVNNPASYWFYATDADNKEPVGVVEWQVYTTNPFPNGPPKLECTWFPEGETREFVTSFINQLFYARANWMHRPFIVLSAMAVKPSRRGQGIGSFLMDWGIGKAEEFNLECWVEASDIGSMLYEKFDFQRLMTCTPNMQRKDPSQTWTRLQHSFQPTFAILMWRPSPQHLREGCSDSFWQVMTKHASSNRETAQVKKGSEDL